MGTRSTSSAWFRSGGARVLAPQIRSLFTFVSIRQRSTFPLPFWIQIASCIALCGALLQPASAVINFCLSGTCDIDNPIYVNVYWDKSKDQSDADIRVADPSATVDAIDALTNAVCGSSGKGTVFMVVP
jgi:hypothetical protein